MPIFALFQGISARSGLAEPFSAEWCVVDNISWGVQRPGADLAGVGAQAPSLGVAQMQSVILSRTTDGASTQLFAKAISGAMVDSVILAITDGASNKTMTALKLNRVFVATAQYGGESAGLSEQLRLAFSQIALAVLTASGMQLTSWDLIQGKPWAEASASFSVDPRWGIRAKG